MIAPFKYAILSKYFIYLKKIIFQINTKKFIEKSAVVFGLGVACQVEGQSIIPKFQILSKPSTKNTSISAKYRIPLRWKPPVKTKIHVYLDLNIVGRKSTSFCLSEKLNNNNNNVNQFWCLKPYCASYLLMTFGIRPIFHTCINKVCLLRLPLSGNIQQTNWW